MSKFDQFRRQIAELSGELSALSYQDARVKCATIQTFFDEHLLSVDGYEQKTSNRELHDLHKKIEKKKPKTKLSLLKKKKAAATAPVNTHVTSNENGKLNREGQTDLSVAEKTTLTSLTGETKVYEAVEGEDLVFRDFKDCSITVKGSCGSLRIENMEKTKVILEGCVLGAAMVRRCEDCEFQIATRQLRIQNSRRTNFWIAVCSKVALEESDGLGFGAHPNLEKVTAIMEDVQMHLLPSSHLEINDFEWPDTHTPSPNWREISNI